jgi:hypothetical protein
MPFWNDQSWPFMNRFRAAGFHVDGIDCVVHTHVHAVVVDGDAWRFVPTWGGLRSAATSRSISSPCPLVGQR